MKINALISTILFIGTIKCEEKKLIDPFELTSQNQENWTDPFEIGDSIAYVPTQKKGDENVYYKRMINKLLKAADKRNNDKIRRGYLLFEVQESDYIFLWNYANDMNEANINTVDNLLIRCIHFSQYQEYADVFFEFVQDIKRNLFSKSGILYVCGLSYVYVAYKMFRSRYFIVSIVKFLLFNLFLWDFVFTWINMYQTEEINKLAQLKKFEEMPISCSPKEMTTLQFLWNAISTGDECKEYHKLIYKDIFWCVSPGKVFSEVITNQITHPARAVGHALGSFTSGILGPLPFGLNIILLPLLLVFALGLLCIILSTAFDVPIGINILRLFSLNFGSIKSDREEIRRLRQYIEEVKYIEQKKNEKCLTCNTCADKQTESVKKRNDRIEEVREDEQNTDEYKTEEEVVHKSIRGAGDS